MSRLASRLRPLLLSALPSSASSSSSRAASSASSASSSASSSAAAAPPTPPLTAAALAGRAAAGALAALAGYHALVGDLRATSGYAWFVARVALPALRDERLVDAERAHGLAVAAASAGLAPVDGDVHGARRLRLLRQRVMGLDFRGPVGLAAGFDKQAEAMSGLLACGFGAVEVGTVVPLPQPGNPKPRMFRLPADGAVINRFGFNSDGLTAVEERLVQHWAPLIARGTFPGSDGDGAFAKPAAPAPDALAPARGLVGVNVGKNKETAAEDAAADYARCVARLAPFADYLTVNISSPNTPGLRALQGKAQLRALLRDVRAARDALPWGVGLVRIPPGDMSAILAAKALKARARPPPILVKIAPDLSPQDEDDIAAVVLEELGPAELGGGARFGARLVDGLIVSNTTVARPDTLAAPPALRAEAGGLSGRPLFAPSTQLLRRMYEKTRGRVALVGAGGVASAEDAYAKVRAGASLVQVYTALAYAGPGLAREISEGLADLLERDGFVNIKEAVGRDAPLPPEPTAARPLLPQPTTTTGARTSSAWW
jgi:dihydroorotate dehydrogenase